MRCGSRSKRSPKDGLQRHLFQSKNAHSVETHSNWTMQATTKSKQLSSITKPKQYKETHILCLK